LSAVGLDMSTMSALLTAVGISIGFAFKGILSHLAAGVMLLAFEPFKVGDFVLVDEGNLGTIYEIDLLVTRLDTPENQRLVVPNSAIFGNVIKNYNHHKVQRIDFDINVDYDADIEETRAALHESISGITSHKKPEVFLSELTDDYVTWQIRIWTERANFHLVKEQIIIAVKRNIEKAKIPRPSKAMQVQFPPGQIEAIISQRAH